MEGLPSAWQWSPAPGLDFACVLSADGGHVFQVASRDSYDAEVFRTVLQAALDRSELIVRSDRPLTVIRDVEFVGRDFDCVVARRASNERRFVRQGSELDELTIPVFPAAHFEFSGDETQEEADERVGRRIRSADLRRRLLPFVRLGFNNPRTAAGTEGSGRILLNDEVLRSELANLEDSPGGFVEFENWQGRLVHVEWVDRYVVTEQEQSTVMELPELLAHVDALLLAD
ncbi:hypothetical protein ACIBTV_01140 [Micromonospora sp. NPDC049366]|uniref:hypothetical protein n=1 Tax=Micromonospora sp. NPDC049366 TaxID=3364271 RepID=UPI0037AE01A8